VTYRRRLAAQWKYQARPKGNPDAEGHVRLQCPAAGPWPSSGCANLAPASGGTVTLCSEQILGGWSVTAAVTGIRNRP